MQNVNLWVDLLKMPMLVFPFHLSLEKAR